MKKRIFKSCIFSQLLMISSVVAASNYIYSNPSSFQQLIPYNQEILAKIVKNKRVKSKIKIHHRLITSRKLSPVMKEIINTSINKVRESLSYSSQSCQQFLAGYLQRNGLGKWGKNSDKVLSAFWREKNPPSFDMRVKREHSGKVFVGKRIMSKFDDQSNVWSMTILDRPLRPGEGFDHVKTTKYFFKRDSDSSCALQYFTYNYHGSSSKFSLANCIEFAYRFYIQKASSSQFTTDIIPDPRIETWGHTCTQIISRFEALR